MFTGLVQVVGRIEKRKGSRLAIRAALPKLKKGDSVAVDGVCLTVVGLSAGKTKRIEFDVSAETYARTALGGLAAGRKVNLELPLRIGDPLGGHFVLGHVDGTGKLLAKTPQGDGSAVYEFAAPLRLMRYLVPKGSVAVDGISLTLVEVKDLSFTVAIIPHTEKNTNLGDKAIGEPVNLEADVLAKHVERLLKARHDDPGGDLFVTKTVEWEQIMREEGYQ